MSGTRIGRALEMVRLRAIGGWVVHFAGTIDDSLDVQALVEGLDEWVVFNLEGVSRITSFGVREWLRALSSLQARGGYVFVRCPPTVVTQFNMVARFGGSGQLVSFFAPYVCPACGAEQSELIDLRRQQAQVASMVVPEVKCPACGGNMEFDDLPDSYLAHAATQEPLRLPALVDQLIDNPAPLSTTPTRALRIELEVDEGVTRLNLSGALDERTSFRRVDGLEGTVLIDLQRVTEITPRGVERLSAFLASAGAETNLMKVPAAVLSHFTPAQSPKIISMLLPFWCPRCAEKFDGELAAAELLDARQTGRGPPCPRCGEPSRIGITGSAREHVLSWPLAELPPVLAVYLAKERAKTARVAEAAPVPRDVLIGGRYQIGALIGIGGMAEIYSARQLGPQGFDRQVALKRILPHLCRDPEFVNLFMHEARVAARLSHPNIVQIIEFGQDRDTYFLAMELVRGWDLRAILTMMDRTNRVMPVALACRIALDVAAALRGAHEHVDEDGKVAPVIHRDVSPHNILVSDRGVVKLTDFGIARATDATGATPGGAVRGKLNYISPERLMGEVGPLDPRPDVFALAIVLYQLLTRVHPFGSSNEVALVKQIVELDVQPAERLRPNLHGPVAQVLRRAFDPKLQTRFATAREFAQALQAASVGLPGGEEQDLGSWLGELVREAMQSTPQSAPGSSIDPTAVRPVDPQGMRETPAAAVIPPPVRK